MASLALRQLRRVPPVLRVRAAAGRREVSRSCEGPQPRPTPPCRPAPQPACRPKPPASVQRGVRIVCCSPPQGAHPPCKPPAPRPPLTCATRTGLSRASRCVPACEEHEPDRSECGRGQDRVARRLERARLARRADYECEVARRTPATPAYFAPYTLGEDRVCTRATDGREYSLPCAPTPLGRCSTARVPPPPLCVDLKTDQAKCRVSDGRLDPCAHNPKVFVEIDRGTGPSTASATACAQSTHPPAAAPAPCENAHGSSPHAARRGMSSSSQQSITSRTMDGLGRGRRLVGPCSDPGETSRKRLHTSIAELALATSCGQSKSGSTKTTGDASGLEAVLRERASLEEAGRGRMAAQCAESPSLKAPPAGRLDLLVPPGAERLTVRVSLAGTEPTNKPDQPAGRVTTSMPAMPSASRADCVRPCAPPSVRTGSWLSLKTIRKRLPSRRRGGGADGCGPPCRSAALRPTPAPSSPRGPSSCSPQEPSPSVTPSPPHKKSTRVSPCTSENSTRPKETKKTSPCGDKKPHPKNTKKCFSALRLLNEIILIKTT